MKNIRFLIVAFFALFMAVSICEAQNNDKQKGKNEECVVFDVNMSCNNCKTKIEKNIPFEKGVKDLIVSLDDKTVTIKYRNDKTSEDNLKKAIEKLGYTASRKAEEKK
jgi:copper chaperone CopZ